jgi:hypothetical protein
MATPTYAFRDGETERGFVQFVSDEETNILCPDDAISLFEREFPIYADDVKTINEASDEMATCEKCGATI